LHSVAKAGLVTLRLQISDVDAGVNLIEAYFLPGVDHHVFLIDVEKNAGF